MDAKTDQMTPVEIDSGQQPWCDLILADGHRLRVQINIAGVWRIEGQFGEDGMPKYQVAISGPNVQAFPGK